MSDWLDRVRAERAELGERVRKLDLFLNGGGDGNRADVEQYRLMFFQLAHMTTYYEILCARITAAEAVPADSCE